MSREERGRWQLGGLALRGHQPVAMLAVPSGLAIEDGWLVSRALQPEDRLVHPPTDLLVQFTRLQTEQDVLAFAQRFGVLRVHEQRAGGTWREPVSAWLRLAKEGRAILNLASALHSGVKTQIGDWNTIAEGWLDIPSAFKEQRVPPPDLGRALLGFEVNRWLERAHARPTFAWISQAPQISFDNNLHGTLAVALMIAVTRTQGVALCSGCGTPYLRPNRRAKRGQNNYCAACGIRAAWRAAARRRSRVPRRRTRARSRVNPRKRDAALLALQRKIGPRPQNQSAAAYWRRFHAQAKAQGFVTGTTDITSRMAVLRARRRLTSGRSLGGTAR
jgi:hypothetical protein